MKTTLKLTIACYFNPKSIEDQTEITATLDYAAEYLASRGLLTAELDTSLLSYNQHSSGADGKGKACLEITCKYTHLLNPEKKEQAKQQLLRAADYLADAGLLTGESPAELNQWKAEVTEVTNKAKLLKPYTFIRIIRQPSQATIRTYTGLYGWVEKVFPKENAMLVKLVEQQDNPKEKARTTSTCVELDDVVVIEPTTGFKKLQKEEIAKSKIKDPVLEKFLNEISTDTAIKKELASQKAIKRFQKGKTNPYLPKEHISRNDKTKYPAFADWNNQGHAREQAWVACKEKLTVADKAKLIWLREAGDEHSMWSGQPLVRALVQELDLDPFANRFNSTLYQQCTTQHCTANQLRVTVIEALNKGRQILEIHAANKKGEVAIEFNNKDNSITHYHVTTGRRRPLPAYPNGPRNQPSR